MWKLAVHWPAFNPHGKRFRMVRRNNTGRTQRRFDRRWLELTGERFRPTGRVPTALVNSLSSLLFVPMRLPKILKMRQLPEVVVFVRKHEGKECDEKAEIAGWYTCNHNGFCSGRAAVLKILNDEASKLCSKTVTCPSKCPCNYVPRKALGSYTCTATLEEGYLLQGTEEWNCFCLSQ
jgi:hypothetical protein